MHDKIEMYKCDQEPEQTPLKLIMSLVKNITNICDYDHNGINQ